MLVEQTPAGVNAPRAKRGATVLLDVPKETVQILSGLPWWGNPEKHGILLGIEAASFQRDFLEASKSERAELVDHFKTVSVKPGDGVPLAVEFSAGHWRAVRKVAATCGVSGKDAVRALYFYMARATRVKKEEEDAAAVVERRIDTLPLVWKAWVLRYYSAGTKPGGFLAETYKSLLAGEYWQPLPARRGRHPGMTVTEAPNGQVKLVLALPSYSLKKSQRDGFSLPGLVSSMTTWGGDHRLRRDIEEAWFGTPRDSLGMHWCSTTCKHRPHSLAEILLTARLWDTVQKAAGAVGATPEQWVYGCIVGACHIGMQAEIRLEDYRRDAEMEIKKSREAASLK